MYLSTTLPALILSMTMACLFLCVAAVRVMPRLAPGDLAISTNRGPEAFVTESEGDKDRYCSYAAVTAVSRLVTNT